MQLTSVDHAHGQAVRREQQHNLVPPLLGIFGQLRLNVLRERLDEAMVDRPPVNDTPLYAAVLAVIKRASLTLQPLPPLP